MDVGRAGVEEGGFGVRRRQPGAHGGGLRGRAQGRRPCHWVSLLLLSGSGRPAVHRLSITKSLSLSLDHTSYIQPADCFVFCFCFCFAALACCSIIPTSLMGKEVRRKQEPDAAGPYQPAPAARLTNYDCGHVRACMQITGETVGEVRAVAGMHQRKAEMARNSDAFIALPGNPPACCIDHRP
jgi:hypothetical protein